MEKRLNIPVEKRLNIPVEKRLNIPVEKRLNIVHGVILMNEDKLPGADKSLARPGRKRVTATKL